MRRFSLLIAAAAIVGFAGFTQTSSPAHAGGECAAFDALTASNQQAFSVTHANGRLDHDTAKLRFQPSCGIAISGGSEANFEESALRAAGDGFGAVVEPTGQMPD